MTALTSSTQPTSTDTAASGRPAAPSNPRPTRRRKRYKGHIQRRDKRRLAARNRLQADGLHAIAEHDRGANEGTGFQFKPGQVAQGAQRKEPDYDGRRRKPQAHEKHRPADGHRMLHQQKGAAPD